MCIQITTPMPMMLWVASIVEGVIENYVDMGILLGIQASSAVAKAAPLFNRRPRIRRQTHRLASVRS